MVVIQPACKDFVDKYAYVIRHNIDFYAMCYIILGAINNVKLLIDLEKRNS